MADPSSDEPVWDGPEWMKELNEWCKKNKINNRYFNFGRSPYSQLLSIIEKAQEHAVDKKRAQMKEIIIAAIDLK